MELDEIKVSYDATNLYSWIPIGKAIDVILQQHPKGYTESLFDDVKTCKKVYEVLFFDIHNYAYSESVFNTPYIEIKYKC